MDSSPARGSTPVLPSPIPLRAVLQDAVRYWEPRRVGYNLALTAMAGAVVWRTWPHFLPAFTLRSIPPLAVLATLANVCYCAAYMVDVTAQQSDLREAWRRRRWILWLVGTLFALLFEFYWIVDEIYPAVPFVP